MKSKFVLFALGLLMTASLAHAQTRTWVSGVGDDLNPCSRTAPCKTFAGALSKTAAPGIINCIDPGGYGAVTITKSVTIDCTGTLGSILASGVNGVNVSTAGIRVVLRDIDINGAGTTLGILGVNITNGSKVTVSNTRIANFSTAGIKCNLAAAPALNLSVLDSELIQNFHGVDLVNNCTAEIQHSYLNQNSSAGVFTESATTDANVANSFLNNNNFGVSAGTNSKIWLFGSQLSLNAQSVNTFGGGVVNSHGNNAILDNTTNIIPGNVNTQ
jgi:hypothetical protein